MTPDEEKKGDEKLLTRAYVDLFSGAASEIGDRLTRAAVLALAPVDLALWSAEHVRDFLSEDLPRRLRRRGVEPDAIHEPRPELLGALLEGLRRAGPTKPLREMFANLLASAMTALDLAHPAFVAIISQMDHRDAVLFEALVRRGDPILESWSADADPEDFDLFVDGALARLLGELGCELGPYLRAPIDNLERLGLIRPGWTNRVDIDSDSWVATAYELRLTGLGRWFATACVSHDGVNSSSAQPIAGDTGNPGEPA